MDIWAGFLVGFLGSFHCIGMCGPIALSLPANSNSSLIVFFNRLLYNIGRTITYSFFGLLFGLFGNRLVLIGLQQYFTILFGVILLLYVFTPQKYKSKISNIKIYRMVVDDLKLVFGRLMRKSSSSSFLVLGIANGFLPCGFVYVALAGAITTGSSINGAIYMALFGLGTIPIMLATSMLGNILNFQIRRKINKLIPVFRSNSGNTFYY